MDSPVAYLPHPPGTTMSLDIANCLQGAKPPLAKNHRHKPSDVIWYKWQSKKRMMVMAVVMVVVTVIVMMMLVVVMMV